MVAISTGMAPAVEVVGGLCEGAEVCAELAGLSPAASPGGLHAASPGGRCSLRLRSRTTLHSPGKRAVGCSLWGGASMSSLFKLGF